jgi:hypothetical protein
MFITPDDLAKFAAIDPAKAEAMIADAEALALLHAPALATKITDLQRNQVKAILRDAILRWESAGEGAITGQQLVDGPFSENTQFSPRRGMFYPSEISQLKQIARAENADQAFAVNLGHSGNDYRHPSWCKWLGGCKTCR